VSEPINDGGPAFPHSFDWGWSEKLKRYKATGFTGMTLRDYFAAAALQALISSRSCTSFDEAAFSAYEAANEMIAFRKQDE
jgi:hypothetical protein